MGYSLTVLGRKTIEEPTTYDVETALMSLRREGPSYMILEREDGSYVQSAGAGQSMTIEYRQVTESAFRHYVLGLPYGFRSDTTIESIGSIVVQKNEVLNIKEAHRVFQTFLKTGTVTREFELRDTTKVFAMAG